MSDRKEAVAVGMKYCERKLETVEGMLCLFSLLFNVFHGVVSSFFIMQLPSGSQVSYGGTK